MMELFYLLLDALLIGLLIAGIVYAVRLNRQLADLRSSRADMERFVTEFSSTVLRAESGIKGLKQAARGCGDDLEQLIEKSQQIRDELHFLTESADQTATRLSQAASAASKAFAVGETAEVMGTKTTVVSGGKTAEPASAAERELLKALEKKG